MIPGTIIDAMQSTIPPHTNTHQQVFRFSEGGCIISLIHLICFSVQDIFHKSYYHYSFCCLLKNNSASMYKILDFFEFL